MIAVSEPDLNFLVLRYLADELAPEQREQFEARVQADAALRAALDDISQAQRLVEEKLERADRRGRASGAHDRAVRDVGRLVRQWHGRTHVKPAAPPSEPSWHWRQKYWLYPAATAATVAFGYLAWWTRQPVRPDYLKPVASSVGPPIRGVRTPFPLGLWAENSISEAIGRDPIAKALAPDPEASELVAVEEDLTELSSAGESDTPGIFLGLADETQDRDQLQ